MEILSFIFEFIYVGFIAVCLVGALILLYDYFKERKEKEFEPYGCSCYESEEELSKYSDCMCDICSINVSLFEASLKIRNLDDPELKFALEELNIASAHICNSLRHIYELNYPIDEEELNK